MCGRFALDPSLTELLDELGLDPRESVAPELSGWEPRYNIAPGTRSPVLKDGKRLALIPWGLQSQSTVDRKILINVRAETLLKKRMLREAALHGRCLIPASGFYEWSGQGSQSRQPHYFSSDQDRLMLFAGVQQPDPAAAEKPVGFAILTTAANDLMAPIHHRMPLILNREQGEAWISDSITEQDMQKLLALELPPQQLQVWTVHPRVNSNRATGPDLIRPWSGGQLSLF